MTEVCCALNEQWTVFTGNAVGRIYRALPRLWWLKCISIANSLFNGTRKEKSQLIFTSTKLKNLKTVKVAEAVCHLDTCWTKTNQANKVRLLLFKGKYCCVTFCRRGLLSKESVSKRLIVSRGTIYNYKIHKLSGLTEATETKAFVTNINMRQWSHYSFALSEKAAMTKPI